MQKAWPFYGGAVLLPPASLIPASPEAPLLFLNVCVFIFTYLKGRVSKT